MQRTTEQVKERIEQAFEPPLRAVAELHDHANIWTIYIFGLDGRPLLRKSAFRADIMQHSMHLDGVIGDLKRQAEAAPQQK